MQHARLTSNQLTAHALPQLFSYVQARDQADKALEIIDLKAFETGVKNATEQELQKAVIREMAIGKARAVVKPQSLEDIRVLRLDEANLPMSKIRNESGFRLVDVGAVRRGDGSNAELVTVIFAKSARDRDKLVPLVFAHTSSDEIGWKIKEGIDEWCTEIHGAPAEDLITTRRHERWVRFLNKIDELKAKVVIGAAIAGLAFGGIRFLAGAIQEADREQEARLVEQQNELKQYVAKYKEEAPARVEFIKQTLKSIESSGDPHSRSWLLNQIQMQHYDTLVNMTWSNSREARIDAAQTLRHLVSTELSVKREIKEIARTDGPSRNNLQSWNMNKVSTRNGVLRGQVELAFNGQTDNEVRSILIGVFEQITAATK